MKTSLYLFFLCLSCWSLSAQVIRQNAQGEKIIVYPDGSWKYFNQKSGGGTDYPVYEASVTPFDNPVLLTEQDALKIATRRSQLAKEAVDIAQDRAIKSTEQRLKLEQELTTASSRESAESENLRRLNIRLSAARKTEVESKTEALIAQQELAKADELTRKGNILEVFKIADANRKSQVYFPKADALSADFFSSISPSTPYYQDFVKTNPYYGLEKQAQCKFKFNGKDQTTGRYRKEMEAQHLFSFTDEKLRIFLKDKEYLSCKGYLSSLDGGYRFLTLEFTFSTPNAKEAYGFIEKGSILTIRLINGDFINLRSGTMDRGSFDTRENLLTYRVHYGIAQDQLGFLEKSEVDKIRVFWSSGYEEYEVYQLDFFMKQLTCLDK
ncbi:MAG TPA: hypothetical protein PLC89_10445 [Haliscomenobacter sp.]|uniref:hypothetical protein n=1 Tax=Haliscomenobacter sp. TaxID=2717303 RepID=UPI002CDD0EAF|nr:hypothetical protein [Haliscomenobacter sp.]HOY17706.1 hypothetical protein [Haliscomenobacter sp.]HPH20995.1 hypothetical protein [Haliscomenobacter sp.]